MNVIPENELEYYWGMYTPVNISGNNDQVNFEAIIAALKQYHCNGANDLGELVDLSSFGASKSGTFTVNGVTFGYYANQTKIGNVPVTSIGGGITPIAGNGGYLIYNTNGNVVMSVTIKNPNADAQDFLWNHIKDCSGSSDCSCSGNSDCSCSDNS